MLLQFKVFDTKIGKDEVTKRSWFYSRPLSLISTHLNKSLKHMTFSVGGEGNRKHSNSQVGLFKSI